MGTDTDGRHRPLLSMGTVQKLTGLTARQIRYYEQHHLIAPGRSPGKQRLFSLVDVARLTKIHELLELGLKLDAIRKKLSRIPSEQLQYGQSSEEDIYRMMEEELAKHDPSKGTSALLRGELARFTRRK